MPLNNPIGEPQIPQAIARDAEFAAADAAHAAALNAHPQYLLKNPPGIEFSREGVNVLDFHVEPSPPSIDFDVRIAARDGTGQNGGGTLSLQAGFLNLLTKVGINGGAQIQRLLVVPTYVDLPPIAAGGIYDIYMSVTGAQVGDVAVFFPTAELYNGLWAFHIQAAVTNNNVARIYFHNLYNTSLDIGGFSGKLLIIGFA